MDPAPEKKPRDPDLQSAALLLAIPTILIVSPLVGMFVGMALDRWWHSGRICTAIGVALGFAAGGRETYLIYRRYQDSTKEDDGRGP